MEPPLFRAVCQTPLIELFEPRAKNFLRGGHVLSNTPERQFEEDPLMLSAEQIDQELHPEHWNHH